MCQQWNPEDHLSSGKNECRFCKDYFHANNILKFPTCLLIGNKIRHKHVKKSLHANKTTALPLMHPIDSQLSNYSVAFFSSQLNMCSSCPIFLKASTPGIRASREPLRQHIWIWPASSTSHTAVVALFAITGQRTVAKSATVQYGQKMPELKKAINLSEKPTGWIKLRFGVRLFGMFLFGYLAKAWGEMPKAKA